MGNGQPPYQMSVDESQFSSGTRAGCLTHDGMATEAQKAVIVYANKGAVRQRREDENLLQGAQASAQHEPQRELL
jgi:hypothetical protein